MLPESDIHARVLAQYSDDRGAEFYRCVMGGGGPSIHYGHYTTPDTPMREAAQASTAALLEMADRHGASHRHRVIDLGSGAGGPAHQIAARTGAKVTCVDLSGDLHRANLREAESAGLIDRIETCQASFDALPPEWSNKFDLAWSQDALCHAPDRPTVFREVRRVLNPDGLFVLSDILRDDNATEAGVAAFTGVNAVNALASPTKTTAALESAGFTILETQDWSHHLRANFSAMLAQIQLHREAMIAEGVSEARIDTFARSLENRLTWSADPVMRWMAFACRA